MADAWGCRSCWWQEGGRCYVGDSPRDREGRSLVEAKARCDSYESKRSVFERAIPGDMLVILSERREEDPDGER